MNRPPANAVGRPRRGRALPGALALCAGVPEGTVVKAHADVYARGCTMAP
jgi:hypothetical protein